MNNGIELNTVLHSKNKTLVKLSQKVSFVKDNQIMNFFRKELVYVIIISFMQIGSGIIISHPSPVIPIYQKEWNISSLEVQFFNAITSATAIIGPFIASFVLKFIGRKILSYILASFGIFFWALLFALKEEIFWFGIVVRALLGFVLGATNTLAPMYIVELSTPELTGFYGSICACGLIIGIILVDLIGEFFRPWACNVLSIVVYGIHILFLYFVPETSPKNSCSCINSHFNISHNEKDTNDLSNSSESSQEGTTQKESILKQPYLKNILICMSMLVIQQFSGANAIVNNLNSILADGGIPLRAGVGAAIAMLAQVITIIVGGTIVNLAGRRLMWLISCIIMFATEYILAFNDEYKWNNVLPVIIMFILLFGYGLGLGSIPSYYASEMFPDSLRATASSFVNVTQWSCSFIVIFIYEPMIDSMKFMGTFVFYGTVALIGGILGFIFIRDPDHVKNAENVQELEA